MYFKDPKTKKESVTLTLLIVGFIVATTKLLVAGSEFGSLKFGEFDGVQYAAALSAISALYWARKRDTIKKDKEVNDE
jgi:hypothetical protein